MFRSLKAMGEVDVKQGLKHVLSKIEQACLKRDPELQSVQPCLVAVSKTKPNDLIIQAYEAGQRHFGENYVKELVEKANSPDIQEHCKEIKWHFIGHLQNNKVNKLLSAPNIYMVETVDNEKLATQLNKGWPRSDPPEPKLSIMVQVNTSGEQEKNGVSPEKVLELLKFIKENCPNLEIKGLMTIGMFGYNPEDGPNPDFLRLKQCRDEICKNLGLDWKKLSLSMGMSNDFEQAIEMGSTYVRVGTSIFGFRAKKDQPEEN